MLPKICAKLSVNINFANPYFSYQIFKIIKIINYFLAPLCEQKRIYHRVANPFTTKPLLAETLYPYDDWLYLISMKGEGDKKHFAVLDKITRQLIFYDFISIVKRLDRAERHNF